MAARAQIVGRTLGEFVVRDKLGEGGSAIVYRAEQPTLAREVVIKILRTGRQVGPDAVQRFLREARLASQFEHPFAAHVYASGAEPDGLLWLAMELVRGTTLDRVLDEQGPMPLLRFVPLLDRLCEVVAAAHEQGIVHRDIKPANVMVVSSAGRLHPKLLDFGVATLVDGEADPGDAASVGSPHYMAPEQWQGKGVDGRADQYALAALAYEALTGARAFDGASLREIARAHATRPPPRVPPTLPSGLDEVFARALAKDPAARYATAIELAAAFRRGAGLDDGTAAAPTLGADGERVFGRAPQPIAEAYGALEAARNPHQARAAMFELVRACVVWLGHLAIAGRARIGGPAVAAARDAARGEHISAAQWLRLVREIVAPFADRAEVHPVPELVEAAAMPALDALIALRDGDDAGGADADRARAVVERALPHLGALCRGLAHLFEYEVVVARGGVAERWTGVRRSPRRILMRPTAGEDGRAMLVDRDGAPVLALWPLVHVAAPAPGLPPEMFLVEGRAPGGARMIALPSGFEHVDEAAWEALRAAVSGPAEPDEAGAAVERAPYRGLAAFTADDAALYVGRERDVESFGNRLRVQSLLVVVGPSGAGKSSFLHAGVGPALDGWRTIAVRPGRAPIAALEARLERELGACGPDLGATLRGVGTPVLLVIDQLEELFTLCPDPAERQRYAAMLVAAARTVDDPVRIVLALRDDFLLRAHELTALRDDLAASLHLLGTPSADDLVRILIEPARRAGYEFDDAGLPRRMADEVSGRAGALPLLSFTAARLWELRDRGLGLLTRKAYDAVGGVSGALARHAEETLAAMPPDARTHVREAFRHLVTAEGTRAVLTRTELRQLGIPDATLEQLVGARLLTASEGERGEEKIEIVHEALIGAWPRLVEWRQEDAEGARLRDQLRAAARQWHERGRPGGLLWRDDALVELQLWRPRYPGALTEIEEAFAAGSVDAAARGRRVRRVIAGVAFAVVLAAAAIIFVQSQRTELERRRADAARALAERNEVRSHQRMLDLYEEQGRQALVDGDPVRSAAYLGEAFEQGGDGPVLRFLAARAIDALSPPPVRLPHRERAMWVAWAPDGKHLVSAAVDGEAVLWDRAGARVATLAGHTGEVLLAEFSADGRVVVTAANDATARVWDAATGAARGVITTPSGRGAIRDAHVSPDGTKLIACGDGGVLGVWALGDDAPVLAWAMPPAAKPSSYRACRFSPDGARIVSAGGPRGGAELIVRVVGGGTLGVAPYDGSSPIGFSPDGRLLASGGTDGVVHLWDGTTAAARAELLGHAGAITDLAFSPDGARVATASRDGTARIWDVANRTVVSTLRGHVDTVASVSWSPDGTRVLTTSHDGSARVWQAADGTPLRALMGHTAIVPRGAFAPGGEHVATAGWDHAVLVWEVRPRWTSAFTSDVALSMAMFAADGSVIASGGDGRIEAHDAATGATLTSIDVGADNNTWSRDGRVVGVVVAERAELRDLATGALIATLPAEHVAAIALGADGSQAVTVDRDGGGEIWDVATATRRARFDTGGAYSVRLSDDGGRVVGYHDRVVVVWDAATGALLHELAGHDGHVYDLSLCAGGPRAVTVSNDRTARVWDLERGVAIATLVGHTNVTLEADFTPDCAIVATGSADGTVKLWDVATGRQLASIDILAAGVTTVHLSADGRRLVTADYAGTVAVWDIPPETRPASEIVAWVRCHVPFRATSGRLELTPIPAC